MTDQEPTAEIRVQDREALVRGRAAFDAARPPGWELGIGALLLVLAVVLWVEVPEVREGNRGIAALELVGNWADAAVMGREHVIVGFVWDLVLIAAYVLVLLWAVRFLGRFYRLHLARVTARDLVWRLVLMAGALDLLEDLLLTFGVASSYRSDWWISWVWPLAAVAAWAKFLLLLLVLGYVLGALMVVVAAPWLTAGPTGAWRGLTGFAALMWAEPAPRGRRIEEVLAGPQVEQPLGPQVGPHPHRKFGIALSGGGIRASSITLGALQVLERGSGEEQLGWGHADAVTAISGGSNMAGGWSISRSARRPRPGDPGPSGPNSPQAWESLDDDEAMTPEERHLLLNLGYLVARSPRGDSADPLTERRASAAPAKVADTRPSAYATVFTGFVVNAAVLLLTLWLALQLVGRVYGWLAGDPFPCGGQSPSDSFGCLLGSPLLVRPALLTLALGLLGIVVWVLLSKLLTGNSPVLRVARYAATGLLVLGAVLLVALVLFPYVMWAIRWVTSGGATLTSVLAALGSLGAVGRVLVKPAARFAPVLGGVVFFVLLVFLAAYWAYGAAVAGYGFTEQPWSSYGVGWWLVGLGVLLVVHLGATPEWWSLAGFYRGKLRLAYATYRDADGRLQTYRNDDGIETAADVPEPDLHAFLSRREDPWGTPLTVCATATVSSRSVRTHYGIPAMSTTFTPERVTMFAPLDDEGAFAEWSCGAAHLDSVRNRGAAARLTTMLAVAISSAAVSPAMGRFRIGPTSMLLTFANIRLGVWMPNPRFAAHAPAGVAFPKARLPYLFKEFVGLHDPTDAYVYLTDGGHWENTGLVELLRTGDFREIVCIDADPGPGDAVRSISEAIDLAALECGARVSLDLDPMRAEPPTSRKPEYSERSVNVGLFQLANGHVGVLWYAKPALVTDMPAGLLAFRETHPSFPRISTLDQFFDTATFVAYRNLGRFNARVVRTARAALVEALDAHVTFGSFARIREPHWAVSEIVGQVRRIRPEAVDQESLYAAVRAALLPRG